MDIIKTYTSIFSSIIIVAYLLSLLARWNWFFALLSNFTLQYCAGALIFLPFLILLNHDVFLSVCMIVIAISSYVQTRIPMNDPWAFSAPMTKDMPYKIKIAQFNKYYKNRSYQQVSEWANKKDIDLLVMQEVEKKDVDGFKKHLKEHFPYTLPDDSKRPDGIVIFSKYPIENLTIKQICDEICATKGVRFDITLFETQIPITFYSVHTDGPIGSRGYLDNKAELTGMAEWISKDEANYAIFMGDWNATPYNPAFKDLLKISGLHYQNYGVLPESTWPSFAILPFMKIPIDHILFSDNLRLENINKDRANGSDHHSLIATFALE